MGIQFDISDELKKRIIQAQAPSDLDPKNGREPGASLPAKHYHVYGATLIACEMIARGHPPGIVSRVSKALGYLYRTARMDEQGRKLKGSSLLPQLKKEISDEELGVTYENWQASQATQKGLQAINDFNKNPSPVPMNGASVITVDGLFFPDALKMNKVEFIKAYKKKLADWNQNLKVALERRQKEADAFELLRRYTLSDEVKIGVWTLADLPYNSIRIPMPEALNDTVFDHVLRKKPEGWSDARFDRARRHLKSLLVDWEWTAEQHAVGGAFAAKVCKPEAKKPADQRKSEPSPDAVYDASHEGQGSTVFPGH